MGIPARDRGKSRERALRAYAIHRVTSPIQSFIHMAGLSGMLLVAAALVALIWANSPWGDSYFAFQHTELELRWGSHHEEASLQHWVNDLLMTFFFFVVGLEIKRELVKGELSDRRRASLPAIAALGGMIVPALLYTMMTTGTEAVRGWGIPMATDIAFALGVLALLGDRVPNRLRVLLLGLAIVDDIGAILVIAIFYSAGLSWSALGTAFVLLALVVAMRYSGVVTFLPYFIVGGLMWVAVYLSGVHATLTGVVLGFLTPAVPYYAMDRFSKTARELQKKFDQAMSQGDQVEAEALLGQLEEALLATESPLDRLERHMHPWTSFVILPIFALVNAGVRLDLSTLEQALTSKVTIGILLGLVLGKLVGILGFTFAATKLGLADLPKGVSFKHVAGMACIAGIGFTVSLFITELAFTGTRSTWLAEAKIGILTASVLAGGLGYGFLRFLVPSSEHLSDSLKGFDPAPKAEPAVLPE